MNRNQKYRKRIKTYAALLLAVVLAVTGVGILPDGAPVYAEPENGAAQYQETAENLIEWAKEAYGIQEDAPLLSGTFLDKAGTTAGDWYALALGRLGLSDEGLTNYLSALTTYVRNKYHESGMLDQTKATEWHRTALTLLSVGGNPSSVADGSDTIDLIADGTWSFTTVTGRELDAQGLNGLVWALITLDAMEYEIPAGSAFTRESVIERILSYANADGGYAVSGDASDPDMTAMVVQALAPYYTDAQTGYRDVELAEGSVTDAVDAALAFLSSAQLPDGDFASGGGASCESVSQVIIAVTSIGLDWLEDERFVKAGNTLYDGLMKYATEDGGFAHSIVEGAENSANAMAGGQALCALAALIRQANGYGRLYDCADPDKPDAPNGYVVNVFDGTASRTADGVPFTEEDQAVYEALPAKMTTEYTAQVNALYEKLKSAPNKEDYQATQSGLELKKAQIESIQADIDSYSEWIRENVLDEEGYDQVRAVDLVSMADQVSALGEYDQEQVEGYDQLMEAKAEKMGSSRSHTLTGLIIFAIVLIVASVLLDRHYRKKKKKQMEA